MIFDRDHYISQPVIIEKELKFLFSEKQAITIFEIGACEGEDSIRYSNLFPKSKIYAFEPLPQNVELIVENVKKHKKHNIKVYPLALSNSIGDASFFVSSGTPEDQANNEKWDFGNKSSSLLEPYKHLEVVSFIDFKHQINIKTDTLNNFCTQNNITNIDFIHMDVQGAELMVLNGADDLINDIKAIWLEVSNVQLYKNQPLYDDIKTFMITNNFVLIKDTVDNISGDHLYASVKHFPKVSKQFPLKLSKYEIIKHYINAFKLRLKSLYNRFKANYNQY